MKTFIVNAARGVVSQKKRLDIKSKLMSREWRMLTDEPNITAKYIYLKDGKLLISVNGLSTYSTWQLVTESSIIMDEGIAIFLYRVVHIDDNIVILNLDGTDNFCFLINDAYESLANASFEDIQWYLYRNCNIDILSPDQKQKQKEKEMTIRYSYNLSRNNNLNRNSNDSNHQTKEHEGHDIYYFIALVVAVMILFTIYCLAVDI